VTASPGGVGEVLELDDLGVKALKGVGRIEVSRGGSFDIVRFFWGVLLIGTPMSVGAFHPSAARCCCARRWHGRVPRRNEPIVTRTDREYEIQHVGIPYSEDLQANPDQV
jgi:hypothetical protein